ncbi:zinc ribbon domain-containing protein [Desulfonema ishimotonii]
MPEDSAEGNLKEDIKLSDRIYRCSNPDCRHVEDRDTNAAKNIRNEALAA